MPCVPLAVFGKDRLRRQIVAVVQREQQVAMAGRIVGLQRQRLTIGVLCFRVPALHLQRHRQIAQRAMAILQSGQRGAMMLFCLDRSPALTQQHAKRLVRFRIVRVEGQCPAQQRFGAIDRLPRQQRQRHVAQQPRPIGRLPQAPARGRFLPRPRASGPAARCRGCRVPAPVLAPAPTPAGRHVLPPQGGPVFAGLRRDRTGCRAAVARATAARRLARGRRQRMRSTRAHVARPHAPDRA